MKAVGVIWFTGRTCIGIVVGYNSMFNERKAYILNVLGQNGASADIQHILNWGVEFPFKEAVSLIEKRGSILVSAKEWVNAVHKEKNESET